MESTSMKSETPEAARTRYLESVNAFVADADENHQMAALVDVLTWTLARIAVGYGTPTVAGDILGRLGRHMMDLSAHRLELEEGDSVRETGGLH